MMRKRRFLAVMILGAAVMASACSQKKGVTEKDLETISDKQLEELLEEADKSDGGGKAETEPETQNTEDAFDPNVPGLDLRNIDPYEMNLFEIFGLDNDFPKPREGITSEWQYRTDGFEMDTKTGEIREGVQKYYLYQSLKPDSYEDYDNEVTEYVQEHYKDKGISVNKDGTEWLLLDGDYDFSYNQYSCAFSLNKWLRTEIEGTVTNIYTGTLKSNETGEETADALTGFILDIEGKEEKVFYSSWLNSGGGAGSWGGTWYNTIYEWDQKLEVGDIVRIEYIYNPEYNAEKARGYSNTWYFTNLEIIGKADTESSAAAE